MGPWEWSSRKPETVSGRADRRRGVVCKVRVERVRGRARPARVRRAVVVVNIMNMILCCERRCVGWRSCCNVQMFVVVGQVREEVFIDVIYKQELQHSRSHQPPVYTQQQYPL